MGFPLRPSRPFLLSVRKRKDMSYKTYLEMINISLRDINEVPLTTAQFQNARGIQAAAKEMVNRAYADILNYSKEWPFLVTSNGTRLETEVEADVQEYLFPEGVDSVDWDSFFIQSDDNSYATNLQKIDIDFYNRHLRARDLDKVGSRLPLFVYRRKDNRGFGLSPIPDDSREYTVTYAAWAEPGLLINYDDEVIIPERYYNVMVSRTRYYLWMFRENPEQASFALNEYERGIRQMHRDLVEKQSVSMFVR